MLYRLSLIVAGCVALVACPSPVLSPTEEFFDRTALLCGNAYEGTLVSTDEVDADFASQRIVMHVRDCSDTEIRIPLHVGDNHSRTWILTKSGNSITLKHDHRHEDGEPDDVTMYGGDMAANSSGSRMNFPADEFSKAMFEANGIGVSSQNTWAMEVRPAGNLFAYEMSRPNRFFRIEFDTGTSVATPPPAWGSQ